MNGPADTMMGFPKATVFTPYAYFRNVSSSPKVVQPSLNWMNGSSPQSANLPAITLQPGQSGQVAVPPSPGLTPESLNLAYTFTGAVDDLIAATGSVDQTGNYVFAVEPHGVGQHGGVSSVYWAYGGGLDTMYTVWNPLSVAQQMQLILVGDTGATIYSVPIRLAPGASQTIDLYELFAVGAADAAGRVMPRGPMQGNAILTGPKNDTTERLTVVISGGIYNSKTATCGETCETCDGFTSVSASPDPASIAVSGSTQMSAHYTWYTGYQYDWTSNSQWSSNATGVATIQTTGQSSPGMAAGVSAGSAQFQALFGEMPANAGQICTQGTLPPCPYGDPAADVPASVCVLTVNNPVNGQVFSLSSNYNSATIPLNASSNCTGSSVTWQFAYSYTAGNGTPYSSGVGNTTTSLGQNGNWQSSGEGGQGTITASATATGAMGPLTANLVSYIDGTTIPNSTITSQLQNLYSSGATRDLLTGIAMLESNYQQFVTRELYGTSGYWPNESYDRGSHVGLMQMPNGMGDAFDWTQNTADGASLFQQKISVAQSVVSGYRANCSGLPGLTAQQLENDALVYYGPYGASGPYYVPNSGCSGWNVNPNNSNGVTYANSVRGQMQ